MVNCQKYHRSPSIVGFLASKLPSLLAFRLTPHAWRLTHCGGYTLIELLISMLMTSFIIVAIYSIFRVQTHSVKLQENRLEAQEYARSVLDIMVREIRNAAYNPLGATLGASCGGGIVPGAPAIITATSTAVSFTYDFRGSAASSAPDGDCDDPIEEITYQYDSPGPQNCAVGFGDITRRAKNDALVFVTEPLTNCNVPTGGFTLAYFIQNSTTAMTTIVPATIQRVQVTLTVRSKNADQQFGGQLDATMTSNADLRNRGLPS